jgi:hypothetical protein
MIDYFEGNHSLDHCIVVATLYLSWNLDDCKVKAGLSASICILMELRDPTRWWRGLCQVLHWTNGLFRYRLG